MKIFHPWWHMLVGALFAGIAVNPAAADDTWQSPGFLVDSFVEIALRSDYSNRQTLVRKWNAPLNYFILHLVGDEDLHRMMIDTHFRHLAELTGLPILPATSRMAANFLVVLTREERLKTDVLHYLGENAARQREGLFPSSLCMMSFATERKGSIVRAVAIIPVDAARAGGELASCVVEELTHAMGLANDSPKKLPSIFSRQTGSAYLTGLDTLLLRMLYDLRIKAGMSEKTVLPILRAVAEEYERDRRFETADEIAARSGLAALK